MSRTTTRDRFLDGARVGDYLIDGLLRREETGLVYLATHIVLPRKAEVKVMHADQGWLRAAAVSVLREACLLEALSHPGIPRVYECGVLPDKRPWSAFEHAHGPTLAEQLAASHVLPVSELVPLLRDAGDVLDHAHARGVTHGAVTADNIARVDNGRFPICLRSWTEATTRDATDRTPNDPEHDVRCLGVIGFRALTGDAYTAGAATTQRCPGAPTELTNLIDRMLAGATTAAEVRDCAGWLAATVELIPTKARWTPPHGLGDKVPAIENDGFQIRISRTPTR